MLLQLVILAVVKRLSNSATLSYTLRTGVLSNPIDALTNPSFLVIIFQDKFMESDLRRPDVVLKKIKTKLIIPLTETK